jgi:hypothetical protein
MIQNKMITRPEKNEVLIKDGIRRVLNIPKR